MREEPPPQTCWMGTPKDKRLIGEPKNTTAMSRRKGKGAAKLQWQPLSGSQDRLELLS